MATAARTLETVDDYLAQPEERRCELIRGTLVDKAEATGEHAVAQASTSRTLGTYFHRKPGGRGGPGGWWFFTELEVQLGEEVFRPDVCGYRRERVPALPRGRPIRLAPDWICEILSPSNPARDRVEKIRAYFQGRVPHYWIIDPVAGTLEVFRRLELAYALVLSAQRGEKVRAEPCEAIEVRVDELLGADPEEP